MFCLICEAKEKKQEKLPLNTCSLDLVDDFFLGLLVGAVMDPGSLPSE